MTHDLVARGWQARGGQKGPIAMSAVTNDVQATGTLTTTVAGRTYRQPANGT
jgi:hypothetical protein